MKSVFLVGCPRSGTTLLQSLLASHPSVASFPESKFFQYLLPEYEPRRKSVGIASRRLKPMLEKYFDECHYPEMKQYLPRFPQFMKFYTRRFLYIMDKIIQQQEKNIWLEKTPEHLHYIDVIEKFVPYAKFIHIVRNGSDVVASLYDMGLKYPNTWGQVFGEVDSCINRWINDFKISYNYSQKTNHLLVKYESIVDNTPSTLQEICKFIGIDFTEKILEDYRSIAKQLIRGRETWKGSVSNQIQNANSQKFYNLFNEEQQQYIISVLSKMEKNVI
jgi:hypothetical protein